MKIIFHKMRPLIMLFLIQMTSLSLSAQFQNRFLNPNNQPGVNLYDIQTKADGYYALHPDTTEGGGETQFERWEGFWNTRVGSSDTTANGTFLPSLRALSGLIQTPVCSSSSSYVANWQNLGPGTSSTPIADQALGMVLAVTFDPANPTTTFYAGTPNSGAWKTTNAGVSWQSMTESLHLPGLGVNCIAVDPSNTSIIYIATGITRQGSYGVGVLKSTDGGATWNSTGLTFDPSNPWATNVTEKILIDPTNGQNVYAIAADKFYKSTDGGTTFNVTLTIPTSAYVPSPGCTTCTGPCQDPWSCTTQTRNFVDMEMKPGDPNTIYLATNDMTNSAVYCAASCGTPGSNLTSNGGAELWKSTDGGTTWGELTAVTTGSSALNTSNPNIIYMDNIAIAVTPAEPNSLFISYGNENISGITYGVDFNPRIHKSIDGGTTWQSAIALTNILTYNDSPYGSTTGIGGWDDNIEVSPTNAQVIYLGGIITFKSIDGGVSWNAISWYYSTNNDGHGDIRALTISNNAGNDALLVGNDGGVGYTANGASTSWTNVSTALPITQFYGLAGSEENPGLIVGGTQDNGLYTYNGGVWSFETNSIGDAYDCAIDESSPNPIVLGEGNNPSMFKSIGNNIWAYFSPPTGSSNGVRPLLANPTNNYFYTGYHDVFKYKMGTSTSWTKISNFSSTNYPGVQTNGLVAVAVSPSNPNVIYAVFGGGCGACATSPTYYFFKTTTGGGLGSSDWQDISSNIYTATGVLGWWSIKSITVNPDKENELWVTVGGFCGSGVSGGSNRVIHSTDYGATWHDYSTNLPSFPANTIICEKGSNGGLYVGTDVGVFYTNNAIYPTSGWVCYSDNLATCVITDLDINYASNTIRAATFGRGIWSSPLACPIIIDDTESSSYSADAFVETEHNIYSTAVDLAHTVTYRAGNQITLQPGFQAEPNSSTSFRAYIHGCDHSGNSFRQSNSTNGTGTKNGTANTTLSVNNNNINQELVAKQQSFDIIPNPNAGNFNIRISDNTAQGVYSISVTDVSGRLVKNISNILDKNVQVDLTGFPSGLYFVKVIASNWQSFKKVIIQN